MHRLLTAAAFIHGNMPAETAPGQSPLSAAEAYDVAAYINSFDRPPAPNPERDYPALSEKPADCPYPPYADRFSANQHKYGPFPPIEAARQAARESDFRLYREDFRRFRTPAPATARTN